jgi:uncharacterized protein (DUF433 family)
MDANGAIRVGDSRVLLDLVIHEFQNGATPESIVESYDSLSLPDVYAVVSHYLRNPVPIDDYLDRRASEATTVRQRIEASQPPRSNLRAMLLARLKAQESGNAPADQRS